MPGVKAERIQISHIFLLRDSVRGLSMPCLSRWCQADCRKMTGRFFCPGKRQQKGALLTHWEIRYLSPWAAVWKGDKKTINKLIRDLKAINLDALKFVIYTHTLYFSVTGSHLFYITSRNLPCESAAINPS